MKSDRANRGKTHYHSTSREPAIPLYVGWKIYTKTKSVELVSNLNQLGVWPTYQRISELNNQISVSVVDNFEKDKAVAASKHRMNLFTTCGYDNGDADPTATKAQYAWHGTVISATQHPETSNAGVSRDINHFSKFCIKTSN